MQSEKQPDLMPLDLRVDRSLKLILLFLEVLGNSLTGLEQEGASQTCQNDV